jgi:hypothetical protein
VKILSTILLIIFSSFVLKPIYGLKPTADKMECCSKAGCEKHDSKPEKNACGENTCNMLSCPIGNYYKPGSTEFDLEYVSGIQDEFFAYDDNRLSFISSDCWHPPKQA